MVLGKMTESDTQIKCKSGGSFLRTCLKFSSDGSALFACRKNTIISFNTKTGKQLSEYNGLESAVINFHLHFVSTCEMVTACTNTGQVATWNMKSGLKILQRKIWKSDADIKSFDFFEKDCAKKEDNRIALISWISGGCARFGKFHVGSGKLEKINFTLNATEYLVTVGMGDVFAVAYEFNLILVAGRKIRKFFIPRNLHFTCLLFHPTEDCVLTGDSLGRVIVWNNLQQPKPSETIFHWHTLPVNCVAVSQVGTFFYSGGDECVLVKWNVENGDDKSFLPRLPSTVECIAVSEDNVYVAVMTGDGGIRILDSRFDVVSVVENLVLSKNEIRDIAYDNQMKALVMNGTLGQVQFYSPHLMKLQYSLDVVGRNRITQERNVTIGNLDVTKLAMSETHNWLGTVEERWDNGSCVELRLKFWYYKQHNQGFHLVSSVEYPHDDVINNIMFQPSENDENLLCATLGDDKKLNIWKVIETESFKAKRFTWTRLHSITYKDFPSRGLAFSSDGTLLAAGFGATATAWLPETKEIKCTLRHPLQREQLQTLHFGKRNCNHLLVAATKASVFVWDLLTLCVNWTVNLEVSLLVSDSFTSYMAAFTKDSKLFVFSPQHSKPVYSSEKVVTDGSIVTAATFVPSSQVNDNNLKWNQRSHLYFVTSYRELYSVTSGTEDDESVTTENDQKNTIFSLIQAKKISSEIKEKTSIEHVFKDDRHANILEQFLDSPIHTMPSITATCGAILQTMLLRKPTCA